MRVALLRRVADALDFTVDDIQRAVRELERVAERPRDGYYAFPIHPRSLILRPEPSR